MNELLYAEDKRQKLKFALILFRTLKLTVCRSHLKIWKIPKFILTVRILSGKITGYHIDKKL
ncbi:MAG: hypothetical protein L6V93_06960 [Clostridiales bacterium]|nr:MAG: hypothetical protein L6V93_06960 [Clostridiales bacterium]